MRCSALGSSHDRMPLSSASKAMPRLASWRLAYSLPQLGVVGEVGTKLQEERAEVLVHAVEVIVIDHRRAVDHPRISHPRARAAASLGAHDPRLLLRPPDVQHTLVAIEALQIVPRDVVLALVLGKAHQIDLGVGHKTLDAAHERIGLGCHRHGRGKALTQVTSQIPHHPAHALQLRHVNVQVHPVDALALEHDVIA